MLCFGHPFGLLLTDPIGRDRAPPKEEFLLKRNQSIKWCVRFLPNFPGTATFPPVCISRTSTIFCLKNRKKLLKYRKLYRTLENNFLDFFRIILVFFTFFKVNFGEFSLKKLHKNSEKSSKNLKNLPKIRKTLAINFWIIKNNFFIFFSILPVNFCLFLPQKFI